MITALWVAIIVLALRGEWYKYKVVGVLRTHNKYIQKQSEWNQVVIAAISEAKSRGTVQ